MEIKSEKEEEAKKAIIEETGIIVKTLKQEAEKAEESLKELTKDSNDIKALAGFASSISDILYLSEELGMITRELVSLASLSESQFRSLREKTLAESHEVIDKMRMDMKGGNEA